MKLIRELPAHPLFSSPCVITIGNFDGMHLGHQAVIQKLKETAHANQIPSVVISFANHPAEILRPEIQLKKITTLPHKIQLMKQTGIDALVLLTFTQTFSEQNAEEFLTFLQQKLPFSHLVLGWDATLGKDRQGDKDIVLDLAKKGNYKVSYLTPQMNQSTPISSSQIRKLIQDGKFDEIEKFLGRRYSIYSTVYKGEGKGKQLGFPTANFNIDHLCTPPLGVYAVTTLIEGQRFPGIANLGIAPTMRKDNHAVLEVHLFDFNEDLYNKNIEVVFNRYIRPEKKFSSIEDLKNQIQHDILVARSLS